MLFLKNFLHNKEDTMIQKVPFEKSAQKKI
jgi:hypothetical protein